VDAAEESAASFYLKSTSAAEAVVPASAEKWYDPLVINIGGLYNEYR